MLDLIEPTDTLLTFVIAGIVFVFIILALGVLLKIELDTHTRFCYIQHFREDIGLI